MPITDNILIEAEKVAPLQAIDVFEKQGIEVTETAEATQKAVENRLFAVTRSINMEVLQDIRDELKKSLDNGQTFAKFKKNITNTLAQKGWTGKRTVIVRGKEKIIQTTPWRLKTIYRTNMQSSLNAGRFARQIENAQDRPFIELIDGAGERGRKTHKSRSGSIQPITSSFWKSPNGWYPPNGFNCTGRTRSRTRAQAKSLGIKIKGSGNPDPGFGFNAATQSFQPKRSDFDEDIWKSGEEMEPSKLS